MPAFTIARVITAAVLCAALERLPYSYYTLTRFLCCLVAAYGAYIAWERQQERWQWAFGATALLFNPFLPVRLDGSTWAVLDVAAALLMLLSLTNRALIIDSHSPSPRMNGGTTPPEATTSTPQWRRHRTVLQWLLTVIGVILLSFTLPLATLFLMALPGLYVVVFVVPPVLPLLWIGLVCLQRGGWPIEDFIRRRPRSFAVIIGVGSLILIGGVMLLAAFG